jgi:hypothetical protein
MNACFSIKTATHKAFEVCCMPWSFRLVKPDDDGGKPVSIPLELHKNHLITPAQNPGKEKKAKVCQKGGEAPWVHGIQE